MLLTTENQELVHLNLRQLESEFDSIYIVSLNLTAEVIVLSGTSLVFMQYKNYLIYNYNGLF